MLNEIRRHLPSQRAALLRAAGYPAVSVRLAQVLADSPDWDGQDINRVLPECPSSLRERLRSARLLAGAIRDCGATADIDLTELHASEFHNGPAFQIKPEQGRLLGDGGAYDAFATAFLGTGTAAYSAIVGLERLVDLQGQIRTSTAADVAVIAHPDTASTAHADTLTDLLRSLDIRVWDLVQTHRLDHHLQDLAALGIPFVVVIGERELHAEVYIVRDATGGLHEVPQHHLSSWLTEPPSVPRPATARRAAR